ncbi:transglutaminase family protein [uncultured Tateyamaria sp.]|uniref:transglutaminase-like domain-containing protein n=1 Tax=uncultured Tateyamaria sp. TaxID=455651 RepID=UPI002635874D|nr:transglutaminase-like domain-containing protein [uncultured Tateyamaria sp.]
MRIRIDVEMAYQIAKADPVLLALEVAVAEGQTILDSALDITDASLQRVSGQAEVGQWVWAMVPGTRLDLRYGATVEITRPAVTLDVLAASPAHSLPSTVLTYLRPSRYCQSDLFTTFAQRQFGHLEGGAKTTAILDWVRQEIEYRPGSSHGGTTAMDTFVSRQGVCRDYTHLVCTLARAAGLPARYASVYGADVDPQDFHAVAQVWLNDAWHLVDATGMSVAEGMAVVACGRDAGDVAFMETSHWADFIHQSVVVTRL